MSGKKTSEDWSDGMKVNDNLSSFGHQPLHRSRYSFLASSTMCRVPGVPLLRSVSERVFAYAKIRTQCRASRIDRMEKNALPLKKFGEWVDRRPHTRMGEVHQAKRRSSTKPLGSQRLKSNGESFKWWVQPITWPVNRLHHISFALVGYAHPSNDSS